MPMRGAKGSNSLRGAYSEDTFSQLEYKIEDPLERCSAIRAEAPTVAEDDAFELATGALNFFF